jgi:hypothetical protein
MRKLPAELMFHEGDVRGLTSQDAAELNFELLDVLALLEYLSPEYWLRGREFRANRLGKPLSANRAHAARLM